MKKIIIAILLLGAGYFAQAIDTVKIDSKITDATVFFAGAEITREANLNLIKGKYILCFENLPHGIDPNSIQVKAVDNATILSVKHQIKFPTKADKTAAEENIEDKIEKFENELTILYSQLSVFIQEEHILIKNSKLGGENQGASIAEIKEAADFYRQRLNEIQTEKIQITIKEGKIFDELDKLYEQQNKLISERSKTYSEIIVAVEANRNINTKLDFSYYIASAGWTPYYDYRVDNISQPMSIVYNANVFQSTGEDWENVNIKLSSNNPSKSGDKPTLNQWNLGWDNYQYNNTAQDNSISSIEGRVLDSEFGEAIPYVLVEIYQNNLLINSAITDNEGKYTIKPLKAGTYQLKIKSIGFNDLNETLYVSAQSSIINQYSYMISEAFEFEEIFAMPENTVTYNYAISDAELMNTQSYGGVNIQQSRNSNFRLRGSRSQNAAPVQQKAQTISYISNTVKNNMTNLEYIIQIPYTIPSNGEDYSLKIKETQLDNEFVYYAIPKIENDAFLTAQINNWTELNLLSGETNIYFNGTFTGNSFVDINNTSDTLETGIGRDASIVVLREGNKMLRDKVLVGKNYKETVGWDITVKNTKSSAITIIVEDQYPISQLKSVDVELLAANGADIDTKTGKLTWKLQLAPGEKKVVSFQYQVKYPKNVYIELD